MSANPRPRLLPRGSFERAEIPFISACFYFAPALLFSQIRYGFWFSSCHLQLLRKGVIEPEESYLEKNLATNICATKPRSGAGSRTGDLPDRHLRHLYLLRYCLHALDPLDRPL